jgi:plastocyanin
MLIVILASTIEAGTIVGTVQARGKSGADDAAGGKYDSRKFKFAERVDYEALRDFVIYIEGPPGTNAVAPTKPVQVVTRKIVSQKGASFTPHLLPIVIGTTVEWPNEDEIFHNVFSISETKEFDLGLYKRPEVKRVTFDKPGRADVFCSIHSTMNCVVLVLENSFFATTDEKGRYSIAGVPPGTYALKAWHERLPGQRQTITVSETGEVRADFTLGPGGPPKN